MANIFGTVAQGAGDVIEEIFDRVENQTDLNQAKIDRINVNNQLAAIQAQAKIKEREEVRKSITTALFILVGIFALTRLLGAAKTSGLLK